MRRIAGSITCRGRSAVTSIRHVVSEPDTRIPKGVVYSQIVDARHPENCVYALCFQRADDCFTAGQLHVLPNWGWPRFNARLYFRYRQLFY